MNTIRKTLMSYKDEEYAMFTVKLAPGIKLEEVIGVRLPNLRKIAKEIIKNNEYADFLNDLPHKYYDENILHSIILSYLKDYDEVINYVDAFLPYVNNWAMCDTIRPHSFDKHKDKLIKKIKEWMKIKDVYTRRFAIDMLMTFYLDEDFKEEYLKIPASVKTDEYYLRMMIAWYYATALAKKYDETIPYLENNVLDIWIHNKTIQKAIESYRISDQQKEYLRTLRRKG